MEQPTRLPKLLRATIVCGAAAALLWLAIIVLDQRFDAEAGFLGPVLGLLLVATVVCAGLELTRNASRWVRALGVVVVVGAGLVVAFVLLVVLYVAAVCGSGACA